MRIHVLADIHLEFSPFDVPDTDADVVVIDPEREVTIDHRLLHSAMDYSPYEGMRVSGFPAWTISRGEIVVENGELIAERGCGKLVKRSRINPDTLP